MSDHRWVHRLRMPLRVAVALLAVAAPAAKECTPLARQLKLDALDQMWGAVLQDAGALLECEESGPSAAQARFYRARALDRLKKRSEALEAYETFLAKDCREGDNEFLCEDAQVSRTALLQDTVKHEGCESAAMGRLLEGLSTGDSYSRIFTAMEISKLPRCDDAKKKALDVLTEAIRLEDDPDFKNEICLSILRIDPSACSEAAAQGSGDGSSEPQFIRVRVFDCSADKVKVSVNMPFSFARAVMESLGPELLEQIKAEGFDVENLWESLRKMGPKQKFEMKIDDDDQCEEIEVWFE